MQTHKYQERSFYEDFWKRKLISSHGSRQGTLTQHAQRQRPSRPPPMPTRNRAETLPSPIEAISLTQIVPVSPENTKTSANVACSGSFFSSLLGSDLLEASNLKAVSTSSIEGKVVGLYLSRHSCDGCLANTAELADIYTYYKGQGKPLEIVFLSCDSDIEAYTEYVQQMPWLALPYDERWLNFVKQYVSGSFKLPALHLFDCNGSLISHQGLELLMEDPEGITLDWLFENAYSEPVINSEQASNALMYSNTKDFKNSVQASSPTKCAGSFFTTLLGSDLINTAHAEVVSTLTIEDKVVGLFLSRRDCPGCLDTTKRLADVYKNYKSQGKPLEIVYVSGDYDFVSFNEYITMMPWLAVPYDDSWLDFVSNLHLPALHLFGCDGSMISHQGLELLFSDPEGTTMPWLSASVQGQFNVLVSTGTLCTGSFFTALLGPDLLDPLRSKVIPTSTIETKVIGLFLSRHSCDGCQDATAKLVDIYEKYKAKKEPFEIVFLSGDFNVESYTAYVKEMPWVALPYDASWRELLTGLTAEGLQLPALHLFDCNGKLISHEGLDLLFSDPEGSSFQWLLDTAQAQASKMASSQVLQSSVQMVDGFYEYKINECSNLLQKAYRSYCCGRTDAPVLGGIDMVALFSAQPGSLPVPGRTTFLSQVQNGFGMYTFLFASAENRDTFNKNQERYIPQYGGFCACEISKENKVMEQGYRSKLGPYINIANWAVFNDRLYFFSTPKASTMFFSDTTRNIERADVHWKSLMNGPSSALSGVLNTNCFHHQSYADLVTGIRSETICTPETSSALSVCGC